MDKLVQFVGVGAWPTPEPPIATGSESHMHRNSQSNASVDSGFVSTSSQNSVDEEKRKPKFLASLKVPMPWKAVVPGANRKENAYKREYSPKSASETLLANYKQVKHAPS
jgi:hypothetical protein